MTTNRAIAEHMTSASLTIIAKTLDQKLYRQAWVTDNQMRAQKVATYREYVDGDFPEYLSTDAQNMQGGRVYNANYTDLIVQTMSDRLQLTGMTGQTDQATAWAAELMEWNRIDGLQTDIYDAAIRDGDTYLLVSFDNDDEKPTWTHELAFDGVEGMLVVHERTDKSAIACAIKIWLITQKSYADTLRVNYYYPDRIERYIGKSAGGSALEPYTEDGQEAVLPWKQSDGKPIGVPVIQFSNRKRGNGGYGISELEKAIPLQDALNVALNSMVMAAQLGAYKIRYAVGTNFPMNTRPGSTISVVPKDTNGVSKTSINDGELKLLQAVRFGAFEEANLEPYIAEINFIEASMRAITATPDQEKLAENASGEARKQAEAPLIGKVQRFQVKAGNSWEDVMTLSASVQRAFGTNNPPESRRWDARWKSAEVRDDAAVVDNILKLRDYLTPTVVLERTSSVTGLTDAQIKAVVDEKESERLTSFRRALQASANTFNAERQAGNGTAPPVNTPPSTQANGTQLAPA